MSLTDADNNPTGPSRFSPALTHDRRGRSTVPALGAASGAPRRLLRLEGALALAASALAYAHVGGGWAMFAALFLVPDLFMLGYIGGPRIGAAVYNLGHATLAPAALAAYGLTQGQPLALEIALIWIAHIGFDRLLGYGLKYTTAFADTHLSRA
ncbi:MAG: DUF4260 domain-containing protein [Roseiarcus sp.]